GPDVGFVNIDVDAAQSARMYDFLQGGVENFSVDRDAVKQITDQAVGLERSRKQVRAKRMFLGRAVRYLAGEAGIRQFLDIGTGIPSAENVHTVAQSVSPDCRVVSVDNDHVVLAYAHELRRSAPGGAADYIDGDLRNPEHILSQAAATLDFSKPIAVVFVGVLHHFPDDEDPWAIVRRYVDAVPSGSYVVIEHIGSEVEEMVKLGEAVKAVQASANFTLIPRSLAEVGRFFEGLELIEPGLVFIDDWRPDGPPPEVETPNPCGVGRKP
ncbi:MAG: SAM-dependent methyltransferase, partial [Acidimicrobiales bacterium]